MGSVVTGLPMRENPSPLTREEVRQSHDAKGPLREFRGQFIIPSKKDLTRKMIIAPEDGKEHRSTCTPRIEVDWSPKHA